MARKSIYETELWRRRQDTAIRLHKALNNARGDKIYEAAGGFVSCFDPKTATVYHISPWEVTWASGRELATFLREATAEHLRHRYDT